MVHDMSEENRVDDQSARRAWRYALLNLAFAAVYVAISTVVTNVPGGSFATLSYGLALATVLAGVGTLVRKPWGHWLAVGACAVVLCGAGLLILLTIMASAYLHGVYGALGKGATAAMVVVVLLVIQIYALWPIVQLRYLLSRRAS